MGVTKPTSFFSQFFFSIMENANLSRKSEVLGFLFQEFVWFGCETHQYPCSYWTVLVRGLVLTYIRSMESNVRPVLIYSSKEMKLVWKIMFVVLVVSYL